jgi:stage IV sporulation protein FB
MVRFNLFGVPVEIQPWFWLTAAFLSGGLDQGVTPETLKFALLFIFAATISILVHEFGHALVGRRLGGGYARIVLWAFGGLAYNEGGRFTRTQHLWRIAAGPGAGFALLLLIILALMVAFSPRDAIAMGGATIFYLRPEGLSPDTASFFIGRMPLYALIGDFLWINFWWGILNLLPVLPLDGGRIAELYVKPRKRVYQIAVATAGIMAAWAVFRRDWFMALFFGFLAYQNYKEIDNYRRH